jgi:hypothetical protein
LHELTTADSVSMFIRKATASATTTNVVIERNSR